MLSERVLEELVRRSALSEALCTALWPDLSVESKLQLLLAWQTEHSPRLPDWLTDLGIEDKSPVVQYFALRHAYLRNRTDRVADDEAASLRVSDEDVARHAKAHALEHPLVKAAISEFWPYATTEYLLDAPQLVRLVKARNSSLLSLGGLAEFLDDCLDKVPDVELAAVAYEYFMRADTKRELQKGRTDFPDGGAAWAAGEGLTAAWELARKAGPALTAVLVANLPTALGLTSIKAEELAGMPERVIKLLAYDNLGRKEVEDLHQLIRDNPGRFSKKAIEALESASEYEVDNNELNRSRWLDSPMGQRATLEAVLSLQQQVQELSEQLRNIRENPPRRGFFG